MNEENGLTRGGKKYCGDSSTKKSENHIFASGESDAGGFHTKRVLL